MQLQPPPCPDMKPQAQSAYVVHRVPLAYPQTVRWDRLASNTVSIHVRIAADGSVVLTRIDRGSGNMAVDAEALRAARLSTYAPARQSCAPAAFSDYEFVATFDPTAPDDDAAATPVPGCETRNQSATLLAAPPLRIPDAPRDLGIREAAVIVNLTVTTSGRAANPQILHSSNNPAIDREALRVASQLRFSPQLVDCVPTESNYTWQAVFRT